MAAAENAARALCVDMQFLAINPETGVNVNRLFHDLVHDIVEFVFPEVCCSFSRFAPAIAA
jgi:hypothetical protein